MNRPVNENLQYFEKILPNQRGAFRAALPDHPGTMIPIRSAHSVKTEIRTEIRIEGLVG